MGGPGGGRRSACRRRAPGSRCSRRGPRPRTTATSRARSPPPPRRPRRDRPGATRRRGRAGGPSDRSPANLASAPSVMAHTAPSAARARPESEPHSSLGAALPSQPLPASCRHARPGTAGCSGSPWPRPRRRRRRAAHPQARRDLGPVRTRRGCIRSPSSRSRPEESATITSVPTMPIPTSEGPSTACDGLPLPRRIRTGQALGPGHPHRPIRRRPTWPGRAGRPGAGRTERGCISRQDKPSNRRTSSPERTSTPPVGSATSSSANGGEPRGRRWRSTAPPSNRITACCQLAVGEQDLPDAPHVRPRCRW